MKQFIKPAQAAKELGFSAGAVRKWIREGKIKVGKTPGGQYLIPLDELERFKKGIFEGCGKDNEY